MKIVTRRYLEADRQALLREGVHPVLARLYAARRIRSAAELQLDAARLLPPAQLLNCERAAQLLADLIARGKRLLIAADYDADGATACALGVRALRLFGAQVDYLVPNRFELGYGLSPELVDLAAGRKPDLLITVDNGIASVEGVQRAKQLGIATLITDHHLPGDELPEAECIVNPNQPGCAFASKALAGVGVMFYVMLGLRAELRRRGGFDGRPEPNLAALTDWSRSGRWPTSCRSTRTTASSSRRACAACAPGWRSPASSRCCAPPAGRRQRPRASTSASCSDPGSTPPDASPT